MLRLAVIFFVIAIMAALLGFGLLADVAYMAARIAFFFFLVLAVLALVGGLARQPPI